MKKGIIRLLRESVIVSVSSENSGNPVVETLVSARCCPIDNSAERQRKDFRSGLILLVVLMCALFAASVCACGPALDVPHGEYLLDGTDKDSYIHIIDDEMLEFINVDMTEYVEAEMVFLSSISFENSEGNTETIFVADATEEQLQTIKSIISDTFNGAKRYYYESSGNGNVIKIFIILDEGALRDIQYYHGERRIDFLSQAFILE